MQRVARKAVGVGWGWGWGGDGGGGRGLDHDQRMECRMVHGHGKAEIRLLGRGNSITQRPQTQEGADVGETNRGNGLLRLER